MTPTSPFAPGTVAVGLHLPTGPLDAAVTGLRRLAIEADRVGFDGVTLSEHHGGYPGYLPVPTLVVAALLQVMTRAWAAPCPTILPLRDRTAVVEELAWLAALHPHRVGAGFVPGYQEKDFVVTGHPFSERRRLFRSLLPEITAALNGRARGGLASDPAVAALTDRPVPVLAGIGGPLAARAAAAAGAGILLTSLSGPMESKALVTEYIGAGGAGPRVLIRRAWMGSVPAGVARQLDRYRRADLPGPPPPASEDVVVQGDAHEIAEVLAGALEASGADSLNVRLYAEDVAVDDLLEQVETFGREVLPRLRVLLAGRAGE